MPGARLELARCRQRWILSPLRLPIPPSRHVVRLRWIVPGIPPPWQGSPSRGRVSVSPLPPPLPAGAGLLSFPLPWRERVALSLSKGRVREPTDRPGSRRHNGQHTSEGEGISAPSPLEACPEPVEGVRGNMQTETPSIQTVFHQHCPAPYAILQSQSPRSAQRWFWGAFFVRLRT